MEESAMSVTTDRPTDDRPRIKHVRASGEWAGSYTTRLSVRGFDFVAAEPRSFGGDDSGPTPMEYVAAALASCLTVVVEKVSRERGHTVNALHVETDATQDVRGFAGTADVPPYFSHVTLTVRLRTDATADDVVTLREEVLRRCPAYGLIAAAGVPVDDEWDVTTEPTR
jgi:uncharacterized OsmC-like protein